MNRVELMNDEPAPESRLLNILCYCTQYFIPERGEGYPISLYEFVFFFDSCDVHSFSIQPFQSCPQAHVGSLLHIHIKGFEKNASSTDTFRIIQLSLFWVRERSTSCSPLSSNFSENSPLCPAVYDNKRESERVKRHWSMFRNFLIP